MDQQEYTIKAINLLPNKSKFAKSRNITRQAVQNWIKNGNVGGRHVLALEEAIGFKVKCYQLRPDLFLKNT